LVTIANLQYGWTLFINPIDEKYHWGRAAIQVTFTILIVTETWVAPIAGYLIDRFGPRVIVCGSGALVAIAWIIKSFADSLLLFYLAAVIAGLGAGPIFAATVGNALKWFPDRRGLATGLTAAGFGAGSALTVVPLAAVIQSSGYEAAYLWFGLGQGLVVMLVALLLRAPQHADVVTPSSAKVPQSKYDYAPAEVLKSLPFWLMYAMFVMVGTSGLMVTAQLAPVAADFAIDNGIDPRADHVGAQFRLVGGPRAQRIVAAVLRMGVRPDRPGAHDVHRLPVGGARHLRADSVREQSDIVRAVFRTGILRLGRDFCVVPGNLHRHLRQEIRNRELRHALYGQGSGRSAGAAGQRACFRNRKLDRGLCGGIGVQHPRGRIGLARIEARADTSDGEKRFVPYRNIKLSQGAEPPLLCPTRAVVPANPHHLQEPI
jgi:hypothetical protein